MKDSVKYTLDKLISAFSPLFPDGLPVRVHTPSASKVSFTTEWQEYEGDIDDLDDISLPYYLQELLDASTVDDASTAFFNVCIGLFDLGCTKELIVEIAGELPWCPERYENRLDQEVIRCLSKYDPELSFSMEELYTALNEDIEIIDIPLDETEELSSAYREKLEQYCTMKGISL